MFDIATSPSYYEKTQAESYYFENQFRSFSRNHIQNTEKMKVVARTFLRKDACSEIIDVNRLSARNLPVDDQVSYIFYMVFLFFKIGGNRIFCH